MVCWFLLGKWTAAGVYLAQLRSRNEFKKFFNENDRHYYVPKFIDQYDNEKYVSFNTLFDTLPRTDDLSMFLKMDIEGGEYRCLRDMTPYLDKLNGMAVEFHFLDICDNRFMEIMQIFSEKFYIAHMHGCNFGDLIYKTNIPQVLEITFINKKMVTGEIMPSKKKYPVEKLDYPNNPGEKDYALTFD
jgi:hypothetical protein